MGSDQSRVLSLRERLAGGSQTQLAFECVLEELATLRLHKVREYGEARYEEPDQPFNVIMAYGDVYRKTCRMRQQVKAAVSTWLLARGLSPETAAGLRETFGDLANYSAMGVQLIDQALGRSPRLAIHQRVDDRAVPPVDQVAFAVQDPARAKHLLGLLFGCTEWAEDRVVAEGWVHGEVAKNEALLCFNYQMGDFELELLTYVDGPNWLDGRQGLSHLGIHVSSVAEAMGRLAGRGLPPDLVVQQVMTTSHTNPAIRDTRRYRYVIYGTLHLLGFDLKLIERVVL